VGFDSHEAVARRKKIPTGDPRCPKEVKLAKRIKRNISLRADVGDGKEEMDLITGSFTDNLAEDGIFDGADGGEDLDNEQQLEGEVENEVLGEFNMPNLLGDLTFSF
jgi:hypothetical protein